MRPSTTVRPCASLTNRCADPQRSTPARPPAIGADGASGAAVGASGVAAEGNPVVLGVAPRM